MCAGSWVQFQGLYPQLGCQKRWLPPGLVQQDQESGTLHHHVSHIRTLQGPDTNVQYTRVRNHILTL
jgi:hypothetical protein